MDKTILSQHDAFDSKEGRTTESQRDMKSSEAEKDAPETRKYPRFDYFIVHGFEI